MSRKILAAVGAIALVTGLTSTVYAKPIALSQPQTGSVTVSGESLQGIQSRSLAKDYPTRFNTVSNNNSNHPFVIKTPAHPKEQSFLSKILGNNLGNKLEITGGNLFNTDNTPSRPLLKQGANGDSNSQGAVLYKLNEY